MVNDAQREHVGGVGKEAHSLFLMENLGREVARSAALFEEDFSLPDPVGQSEVGNDVLFLSVLWISDHDVLELQVSMHDSLLPQMLKTQRDILHRLELILLTDQFSL
jgi:hypothetical protein